MKRLVFGLALGVGLILGLACSSNGDDDGTAAQNVELQKQLDVAQTDSDVVDIYAVQAIFHRGVSRKDLDQTMALWADNATLTFAGTTHAGKAAVRNWFASISPAFKPEANLASLSTHPKTKVDVQGDMAKMYFECHFADLGNKQLLLHIGADTTLTQVGGKWLITSMVLAPAPLTQYE
jgi:hypothetical protein